MGHDVELLQSAFAAWRWCVHIGGLSGDEADSDGAGGSDDDESDDDDFPEPVDDVDRRIIPLLGLATQRELF